MCLRQASADAICGLLGAHSDEDAAVLIARFCQQRPGFHSALLKQLEPQIGRSNEPAKAIEPRKRICRRSEARLVVMPSPGANGGEYLDLAVYLLSGRHVASVGAYSNDLVAVLKAEIERVEGTKVWQQQLLIDDCTLEDQETLQSYCFHESAIKGQFVVTLARRDSFIPAAAFQESRPGYAFKQGEYGLGYYADVENELGDAPASNSDACSAETGSRSPP